MMILIMWSRAYIVLHDVVCISRSYRLVAVVDEGDSALLVSVFGGIQVEHFMMYLLGMPVVVVTSSGIVDKHLRNGVRVTGNDVHCVFESSNIETRKLMPMIGGDV